MSQQDDMRLAGLVAERIREGLSEARGHNKPLALDWQFAEKLAELLERLAAIPEDSGTW